MPIQYRLAGLVCGVYLSLQAESLVSTPQALVHATLAGFDGDRHAGVTRLSDGRTPKYPRGVSIRNDRQVSLLSVEELEQIAQALALPKIQAEWLGANMLLRGIPNLSRLPPSTRLYFSGGASLVITSENRPCIHPGRVIAAQYDGQGMARQSLAEEFVCAAQGRRGLVACVERPGVIRAGETVEVEVPELKVYSPV